ncbi:MAG: hypothetical protein IPG22_23400 [Acidobacteria bacterium]|nr:hypothetical protein [Acidobacteriota bacterium]
MSLPHILAGGTEWSSKFSYSAGFRDTCHRRRRTLQKEAVGKKPGKMITGYQRVSRRSPCRICGKPDWCSTTKDQNIAFCARSATNADRLSGKGWGIFYDESRSPLRAGHALPQKQLSRSKSTSVAPIEIRHKSYQSLIKLSPLPASAELIYGNEWLFRQGQEFGRWGILPKLATERHRLVRLLSELLAKEEAAIPPFEGVPGFWRGPNGRPRLGSDFDYNDDLLLIPFLDSNGLIQACQMKAIGKTKNAPGKYQWLSSIGKRDGCSSGTPLHHEGPVGFRGKTTKTVLVTEGVLKAAAAQHFLPDRYVVASGGVATSHREIVKAARQKILEIAFDADCFTNPHVARALASLLALTHSGAAVLIMRQTYKNSRVG